MNRKRTFILLAVVVVLAALVYLQFREWRRFDWATFVRVTSDIDKANIALAVLIIYATYALRAVRWKIFLRPVCKARLSSMVPPQFIGFTGLALLGRPGELIRPYLIAKKESLTFSSQVAVWAVERIFDIGAFAVLMAIDVFVFSNKFGLGQFRVSLHWFTVPFVGAIKVFGGLLLVAVAVMAWIAYKIRLNAEGVARWSERKFSSLPRSATSAISHKVRAFGAGLNTIHNRAAFIQLTSVSLAIWFLIALAYRVILHSYPDAATKLHGMGVPHVLLLMGASMVGSLLQLPAVGGGSQLATISVMHGIFAIPSEQAVSAGMMLWLVTFVACVPIGLIFAHREHLSLRKLTQESTLEEQEEELKESSVSPQITPPAGPPQVGA
jgi:uncharacterized protein (TIRG00374 family)